MSTLTFCSFACVKAYLRDTNRGNQLNLFSLYLRLKLDIMQCVTALPKELLREYSTAGGYSIEEFRKRNSSPIDEDITDNIFQEAKEEDVSAVLSTDHL
jgi:hypothetical protein